MNLSRISDLVLWIWLRLSEAKPRQDYNDAGTLQYWFAYGNYIDEALIGGTLSAYGTFMYYGHEHLYSPVLLTSYTGTVYKRYEYDAYSNRYILEPKFAPDPDNKTDYGNPYYFTRRQSDVLDCGNLKVQYNRNRYYDYCTGTTLVRVL